MKRFSVLNYTNKDVTVKDLKENLKNVPDDYKVSFSGSLESGVLIDNESKSVLFDEFKCIDEIMEELGEPDDTNNKDEYSYVLHTRQYAQDICEIFEHLLDEKDITIPNYSREGDNDESRLFGDDYYKVEDAVNDTLSNLVRTIKSRQNIKFDFDTYGN